MTVLGKCFGAGKSLGKGGLIPLMTWVTMRGLTMFDVRIEKHHDTRFPRWNCELYVYSHLRFDNAYIRFCLVFKDRVMVFCMDTISCGLDCACYQVPGNIP